MEVWYKIILPMEKMNPTINSYPSGQKQGGRETSLKHTSISPSPHLLFLLLRVRYHTHSLLHLLLIYLASHGAQQVISGMWANSKQASIGYCGKTPFCLIFLLFVISHNIISLNLWVKLWRIMLQCLWTTSLCNLALQGAGKQFEH